MARAAAAVALALAALASGCQSPKGSCAAASDCTSGERCDEGVCVRLPILGGNGSGGGTDPASFAPVLWSTLEAAATATFSVDAVSAGPGGDVYVAGGLEGAFDPWTLGTGGFAARLGPTGAYVWSVPFPTFSHGALRTAAAPDGGLLFAGTAYDSTTIGGSTFTPPASGSLIVGRLDASGAPVWAFAVDDTHATVALAPVSLASRGGDLVIAGTGAGDFGCGGTGGETFAAALAYADGACLWSRGLTTRTVSDLEPRDAGDLVLAGLCTPSGAYFDPGGGATCTKGLFIAALSGSDGTTAWSRTTTGTGAVTAVRDVAVSPSGGIAVVGDATGAVEFGGAAVDFGSSEGSFVAMFQATGAPGLVVRPVEAPYALLPDAASFSRGAYDRNGKLWIAGRYYGQPTVGALRFSACRDPACRTAVFLARVESDGKILAGGSFLPVRAAPVAGSVFADDLVLHATTGSVALALRFTGAATVGPTPWSTGASGLGVLRIVP